MIPFRNVPKRMASHDCPHCTITREVRKTIEIDGEPRQIVTFEEVPVEDCESIHYRCFDPDKCAEIGIKAIPPVMGNDPILSTEAVQKYSAKIEESLARVKEEYEQQLTKNELI